MSEEYHAIKWLDENTATRKTREVDLRCEVLGMAFHDRGVGDEVIGYEIRLTGTADLPHHLVEDSAILLRKMCEKFCGGGH